MTTPPETSIVIRLGDEVLHPTLDDLAALLEIIFEDNRDLIVADPEGFADALQRAITAS